MQNRLSKILLPVFILTTAFTTAKAVPTDSTTMVVSAATETAIADTLFTSHQYTQAFERYQRAHASGHYSPAMLLKMAFIQEGLGHLGESLYYLNLYYLATDDTQALKKMEELAKKNNLEGYETDESSTALAWLQEYYATIAGIIAACCILLLSIVYYLQRKKLNTTFAVATLLFTLTILFVHINFSLATERGIVAKPQTYLMSGPSAGSSVVAIIGEGHQLDIQGQEDVWLRVKWKGGVAYVREWGVMGDQGAVVR